MRRSSVEFGLLVFTLRWWGASFPPRGVVLNPAAALVVLCRLFERQALLLQLDSVKLLITQFTVGLDNFASWLQQWGFMESEICECDQVEKGQHVFQRCPRWESQRMTLKSNLQTTKSVPAVRTTWIVGYHTSVVGVFGLQRGIVPYLAAALVVFYQLTTRIQFILHQTPSIILSFGSHFFISIV